MGAPHKPLGITDAEFIQLRRDGQSIMKIAALLNVSRKLVESNLRRLGTSGKLTAVNAHTFWLAHERATMRDMLVGGFSDSQIAARLGRTSQGVNAQFWQWRQNEKRKLRSKTPTGAAPPVDVAALVPVPADWSTILQWGARIGVQPLTLRVINDNRLAQGVSPYAPTEPYQAWKRRMAA